MEYWVYENYPTNKAVVHMGPCSCCQCGQGASRANKGTRNGKWHGPFGNVGDARSAARNTRRRDVHDCGRCTP